MAILTVSHSHRGFENVNDMLVPVIWFEESAMIPEESAKKFKSLYTDRIRLVNIILSSLFVAAVGLLAIDARLLASQNSYFKVTSASVQAQSSGKPSTVSGLFSTFKVAKQQVARQALETAPERRTSATSEPLLAPIELAIPFGDSKVDQKEQITHYTEQEGKSVVNVISGPGNARSE